MKCQKEKIMAALGKTVFLDDYGIATIQFNNLVVNLSRGEQISLNQLYKATNGDFFEQVDRDQMNFIVKENWDSETYYMRDQNKQSRGYYGYGYELRKGQEKEVKIKSLTIGFRVDYHAYYGQSRSNGTTHIDYEFKNKKELDDFKVRVIEDFDQSKLIKPDIADIKLDKIFYCVAYGVAKVIKVYDYPNRNDYVCDIETERSKIITISSSFNNLFYLPYDKPKSKLLILDEFENETALMPYVIREGQTFNVYWKSIDNASDYIVSLYKIIEYNGKKNLYHLNDYTVDRNEKMFVISGLIGNTFVFKVIAEDRSGKKIAESRGIVNGLPRYFVEEE